MAVVVIFDVPAGTVEKYDQVNDRLKELGKDTPAGRLSHVMWTKEGGFQVAEVWESTDALDAFGGDLAPVMQDAQLPLGGPPHVHRAHNVIIRQEPQG